MNTDRQVRWVVLIVAQACTIGWAYTAITHLLAASPNRQMQMSQYSSTSQPESVAMARIEADQLAWSRQSLFSVACSLLVLTFVLINWVTDGRPPPTRT